MRKGTKPALVDNSSDIAGYDAILSEVVDLLESARHASARAVNVFMTTTYWQIGRRIVEWEQAGKERAAYGEALLNRLSADLTKKFGRGFSRQNLQQMRQFYRVYPPERICQTLSGTLLSKKCQTPSGEFMEQSAEKNAAVARYALEGLTNTVMAAEYRMALPDEKMLAAELERTRRMLEGRRKGAR